MGFWQRVIGGFLNTAQEELVEMLAEFEIDYEYEPTFVAALPVIEQYIFDQDYNSAWRLFQETAPMDIAEIDWELFEELLIDADSRK